MKSEGEDGIGLASAVTISSLLVLPYLVIKDRPLLVQWRPHVETRAQKVEE